MAVSKIIYINNHWQLLCFELLLGIQFLCHFTKWMLNICKIGSSARNYNLTFVSMFHCVWSRPCTRIVKNIFYPFTQFHHHVQMTKWWDLSTSRMIPQIAVKHEIIFHLFLTKAMVLVVVQSEMCLMFNHYMIRQFGEVLCSSTFDIGRLYIYIYIYTLVQLLILASTKSKIYATT